MILSSALLLNLQIASAFKTSDQPNIPLNKPYDQQFEENYSPLKLLYNYGPYSSRRGEGISLDPPSGCSVDQVVLFQRHGARYPSPTEVLVHQALLDQIHEEHPEPFTGDLEFLNNWKYFLDRPGDAGLEIASGPYAGISDLFEKGSKFMGRYGHLWDNQSPIPLFVDDDERVVQSARAFGQGFFGYNYSDLAQLNIIPSGESAGANSVSPKFCRGDVLKKLVKAELGGDYLVFPELDKAAIRLNEQYNLNLSSVLLTAMFDMGSYEVSIRGDSPWLNVFTREEWLTAAYRQAVLMYQSYGEGNDKMRVAGASWANATTRLLNQGPNSSDLPIALNFGHDTDILAILGGIKALSPLKPLSSDRVTFRTGWDLADIVPMGAQLILERLKCNAPGLSNDSDLIDNNATIPDAILGGAYGESSNRSNASGYFSTNYTNSTTQTSFVVNGTSSTNYKNQTIISPFANTTIIVNEMSGESTNNTFPQLLVTNITSVYGFNRTSGTTDGKAPEDSYFVRAILNDAVLPLDFCYDGPGYSCSLKNWSAQVEKSTQINNMEKVCHPKEKGLPDFLDYYWNYNKTTANDTSDFISWQGQVPL